MIDNGMTTIDIRLQNLFEEKRLTVYRVKSTKANPNAIHPQNEYVRAATKFVKLAHKEGLSFWGVEIPILFWHRPRLNFASALEGSNESERS